MYTDPIADYLTRLRNGLMAGHDAVVIPASKIKMAISEILKRKVISIPSNKLTTKVVIMSW